jgi:hypothetical protein
MWKMWEGTYQNIQNIKQTRVKPKIGKELNMHSVNGKIDYRET